MSKQDDRFVMITKEGSELTGMGQRIIFVDRETGVQYLWIKNGYAGGLTPLLGPDGKPIVSPV